VARLHGVREGAGNDINTKHAVLSILCCGCPSSASYSTSALWVRPAVVQYMCSYVADKGTAGNAQFITEFNQASLATPSKLSVLLPVSWSALTLLSRAFESASSPRNMWKM